MKKLLAIILSVICTVSCFSLAAQAADNAGGVIGELANTFFEGIFDFELEEDTPLTYGVNYEIDPFSGVSVVYKPSPTISFKSSGTYTITSDTPLSIDYEFICWEDSNGKTYYGGDKIYVDGTITLYAVWVEKDDNDVRVARIIKTTFEALKRLLGKFFGFFKTIVDFVPGEPAIPGEYDLTLNGMYYEDKKLGETEGDERVLLYIDSYGIYEQTGMNRIDMIQDATKTDAEIYLCTGWHEATGEALNKEVYSASYSFAELTGPKSEDVLVIPTASGEGGDIVSSYVNDKEIAEGQTFYMVVTVADSLYSSSKEDTGLEYNELCHPVSCVFTLTK